MEYGVYEETRGVRVKGFSMPKGLGLRGSQCLKTLNPKPGV